MKLIKIYRGKSENSFRHNEKLYDATIEVFQNENKIFYSSNCNIDSIKDYTGGRLKGKVRLYGIVVIDKNDDKVLRLFKATKNEFESIQTEKDLTFDMQTLISDIPNSKYNNKNIITRVSLQRDSKDSDNEHGSITLITNTYDRFIDLFAKNEKVMIFLY